MGSHGWYDGPRQDAGRPPYPGMSPPPYPPWPYGRPPPRRRSDAPAIALAVALPVLAAVLVGVLVVAVVRSDLSDRPGLVSTLTQVAAAEASLEAYWSQNLPRAAGADFRPARLEHFSGEPGSTCRRPPGELEAFYCPRDEAIFISLEVYPLLADALDDVRASAFARAALLAHEYGHHVQLLTGSVRGAGDTGHDVARLELQADCYAGVWAHAVWRSEAAGLGSVGAAPRPTDIASTFALIGDLAPWDPRSAAPAEDVHGSAEQREAWFMSGYVDGKPAACDTTRNVGPDGFPRGDEKGLEKGLRALTTGA